MKHIKIFTFPIFSIYPSIELILLKYIIFLERDLGARSFVFLYLLCGVAGGVLQLMINPGPTLIGAS